MEDEQAVTGHVPALSIGPLKALIGEPWSIEIDRAHVQSMPEKAF
jgi:hypothetical protein